MEVKTNIPKYISNSRSTNEIFVILAIIYIKIEKMDIANVITTNLKFRIINLEKTNVISGIPIRTS